MDAAPKLEVLTGPLKSAIFTLPENGEVTVGRDDDNVIRIPHSSVSRHHCAFRRTAQGTVYVSDLGSRNGTLVNGIMVSAERLLKPGDEVHIGTSLFVLAVPASQSADSLLFLRANQSRFLSGRTLEAGPITVQVVRLLDALLKASISLGAASNYAEWERILVDAAFALTSADRVAVLEPAVSSDVPRDLEAFVRDSTERSTLAIDSTLIAQAIVKNQALTSRSGVSSALLAAPIRTVSEKGLIYLAGKAFSEDDLHAVAAVATLAGLAWERVSAMARLEAENQRLWTKLDHDLVGSSDCIKGLVEFIGKVAHAPANILILGESGTGKDLVAKAIHRNGPTASKPYITINCGAIPQSLIESELFGAERGAFTGATTLRKGLFESTAGGTVFLDEISELPLSVQPTLLRVLQNREVRRLGGSRTIAVDFRLVSASNRDLAEMVAKGQFRADLFHRLGVVSRTIAPLRDRPEDVPQLTEHFIAKYAARSRPACRGISKSALRALSAYSWPGNVRELENAIERAVLMGTSPLIELEDLPETISETAAADAAQPSGFHEGVASAKRRLVQDALKRGGTFVEAARILEVNPNYLHRLVNNLGLRRPTPEELASESPSSASTEGTTKSS